MSGIDQRVFASELTRRAALKAGMLGTGAALGTALGPAATLKALAMQDTAGGSLVIGKPYEIIEFDPQFSANQTSWEIHAVVYESLLFLDDNLGAVPGLAESWETPNDTTYVFKIRQGVKFHNGREMTTDDVVYSMERVLTDLESWWNVKMGPTLPQDPSAATAVALGTPAPGPQIGVTFEATGPSEVTATLSEPYAPFLQALTGTTTAIIPAQEVESGEIDLSTEMVGTGPFQVAEHAEDQRWVFAKFDEYWQEDLPRVDEVVWQVMTDEAARVAALRTGEIHIALFENPAMLNLLENDEHVTTVEQVTTNYYILFVNGSVPELEDERVRQAISIGIDREQIKDTALFGRATATGPIAAGFTQLASPLEDVPFYTRDVERAKSLLAEAGYPDGLKLTLLITPELAATVPMAELIQSQLREVGIEIEIVQRDIATFINEYAVEGTAQLTISWWAGYSDPYLILLEIASDQFGPLIGLESPEIDALIARAGSETDAAARLEVLKELEAAVATSGNFQPLVTRDNFLAYRSDIVGNAEFAAADGFGLPLWHRLQDMTVQPG